MARGLPQCDESWPFGSGWRDGEDAGGSGTREGRTRGEGTGWERTRISPPFQPSGRLLRRLKNPGMRATTQAPVERPLHRRPVTRVL